MWIIEDVRLFIMDNYNAKYVHAFCTHKKSIQQRYYLKSEQHTMQIDVNKHIPVSILKTLY